MAVFHISLGLLVLAVVLIAQIGARNGHSRLLRDATGTTSLEDLHSLAKRQVKRQSLSINGPMQSLVDMIQARRLEEERLMREHMQRIGKRQFSSLELQQRHFPASISVEGLDKIEYDLARLEENEF